MGPLPEVSPRKYSAATCRSFSFFSVIPAKAEIQEEITARQEMCNWIPAFAGMTVQRNLEVSLTFQLN
jgi:hypothetical protein